MAPGKPVDWDSIFGSLQTWKASFMEQDGGEEPSVTSLALAHERDPWVVLVSTILSLRTKDAVTISTSRALLSKAPDPRKLLELSPEETERLAYPAGFYRTKAAKLRKIASILIEDYGGKVPDTMEQLLELPGVGRKTANLVLSEAFDQDAICVDIHVHRICKRTGWVEAKSPDETETVLRNILPRRYWKIINAMLVLYGQQVCKPVSPLCSVCCIRAHCKRIGVTKSR